MSLLPSTRRPFGIYMLLVIVSAMLHFHCPLVLLLLPCCCCCCHSCCCCCSCRWQCFFDKRRTQIAKTAPRLANFSLPLALSVAVSLTLCVSLWQARIDLDESCVASCHHPCGIRHPFPPASPRLDSTWKIICMKSNRTENQLHSRRARPGALGNSSCGSSRPHPKHPHTHRRTLTHTHTKHTQTWISCFHLHHAHNLQPFLDSLVHSFLYPATIEIGQRGVYRFWGNI